MKNERFAEFQEMNLSMWRRGGWSKEVIAKETLAWELHKEYPPAGSVLLGDLILGNRISHVRKDLEAVPFARQLLVEGFSQLFTLEEKDCWDQYYLGACYASGRGTELSHSKAAEWFALAAQNSNEYAEFEAIWARHLSGGSRLETILRFRRCGGKVSDYARLSADALVFLDLGPIQDVSSPALLTRIIELIQLQHRGLYHNQASRQINISIAKELSNYVEPLRCLGNPTAYLALYLIARDARSNPTASPCLEWFQKAIVPESTKLNDLCNATWLGERELQMILDTAEKEGWVESPLLVSTKKQLEAFYAEE